MIEHSQVFMLKGADGQPPWAYRYRFEGRGSARPRHTVRSARPLPRRLHPVPGLEALKTSLCPQESARYSSRGVQGFRSLPRVQNHSGRG